MQGGWKIKGVYESLALSREGGTLTYEHKYANLFNAHIATLWRCKSVWLHQLSFYLCSFVLPSLSSDILVIIYGFLCGFVYEYNCAHRKRIKWHSGLLLLFSSYHEWIYLAWVPRKSSALGVQQESGLARSEGQSRGQDWNEGTTGTPASLPAVVCRWQLSSSPSVTAAWARYRAPTASAV